jgi:hypothetical protein
MAPRAALNPIDLNLVPFQVGEKVAFHDDHSDERVAAKYGLIEAIGLDADGALKFDLAVLDPFTGDHDGGTKTIYRAGMEDIQ